MPARNIEFGEQFTQLGNVVVALDHGGNDTKAAHRRLIQRPDRVDDRMVVGIDDMGAQIQVTGEMELPHPVDRDTVEIGEWIETMIEGTHINIVDVEQDQAVGFGGDGGEKFPLGHHGCVVSQIAGDIFQQNLPPEKILHLSHPCNDVPQGFFGVGQRQQVVQVQTADAGPAQMIGQPGRLDALDQRLDLGEVSAIERIGAADRQRNPVHDHGVERADTIEVVERLAAGNEIVFGEDFKPVDCRPLGKNGLVMLAPQPQAKALDSADTNALMFHRMSLSRTGRSDRAGADELRTPHGDFRLSTGFIRRLFHLWRCIQPRSWP